jgi:hypothetical protein
MKKTHRTALAESEPHYTTKEVLCQVLVFALPIAKFKTSDVLFVEECVGKDKYKRRIEQCIRERFLFQ